VLLAALLHDIGHFPIAHDLEDADKETFDHVRVGVEYLKDSTTQVYQSIEGDAWITTPERVVEVLSAKADKKELAGSFRDRLLHSLIDGPIDADKLDYLLRDSEALSLPYGRVIDVPRLLRSLTVIYGQFAESTYVYVGIHEKGKVIAESMAFARYAMHTQVYWHHSYRSVKVMISQMAWAMIEVESKRHRGPASRRKSFVKFIAPLSRTFQQTLLDRRPESTVGYFPGGSRISTPDLAVLDWLASFIPFGTEYISLLEKRLLFRRIFVLSETKDKEDLVSGLFDLARGVRPWRKRLRLQRAFERAVLQRVRDLSASKLSDRQKLDRAALFELAEAMPVILVDIPREKPVTILE
jgi:hypothetical protein